MPSVGLRTGASGARVGGGEATARARRPPPQKTPTSESPSSFPQNNFALKTKNSIMFTFYFPAPHGEGFSPKDTNKLVLSRVFIRVSGIFFSPLLCSNSTNRGFTFYPRRRQQMIFRLRSYQVLFQKSSTGESIPCRVSSRKSRVFGRTHTGH